MILEFIPLTVVLSPAAWVQEIALLLMILTFAPVTPLTVVESELAAEVLLTVVPLFKILLSES